MATALTVESVIRDGLDLAAQMTVLEAKWRKYRHMLPPMDDTPSVSSRDVIADQSIRERRLFHPDNVNHDGNSAWLSRLQSNPNLAPSLRI